MKMDIYTTLDIIFPGYTNLDLNHIHAMLKSLLAPW